MIKLKNILAGLVAIFVPMIVVGSAAAHVKVTPAEVTTSTFQTFCVCVPNEKDNPTIMVKLLIPEGVEHVTPTTKAGWQVSTEQSGSGEDAVVTSITWSGGAIPVGQRDDFSFSAKTPATASTLQWKAYQTYQDGSVVAWDQAGESETEGGDVGPASVTKVVSQLSGDRLNQALRSEAQDAQNTAQAALLVAIIALAANLVFMVWYKPALVAKKSAKK